MTVALPYPPRLPALATTPSAEARIGLPADPDVDARVEAGVAVDGVDPVPVRRRDRRPRHREEELAGTVGEDVDGGRRCLLGVGGRVGRRVSRLGGRLGGRLAGRLPGRGPLPQGLGDGGRLLLQDVDLGLELLLAGQHLAPQTLLLRQLDRRVHPYLVLGVAGLLDARALGRHHVALDDGVVA